MSVGFVETFGGFPYLVRQFLVFVVPVYLFFKVFQFLVYCLCRRFAQVSFVFQACKVGFVQVTGGEALEFGTFHFVCLLRFLVKAVHFLGYERVDFSACYFFEQCRLVVLVCAQEVGKAVLREYYGAGELFVIEPYDSLHLAGKVLRVYCPVVRGYLFERLLWAGVAARAFYAQLPRGAEHSFSG